MSDIVEWLRSEVDKRLGPWMGEDRKGNPERKEPLQTCIVLLPMQAIELLKRIDSQKQEKGDERADQ